MMLNAPLEYDMVMGVMGDRLPDADFIEHVSYASCNPYFRGKLFRQTLLRYRKNGGTQRNPCPPPTPEMKLRALQIRKRKMYGL